MMLKTRPSGQKERLGLRNWLRLCLAGDNPEKLGLLAKKDGAIGRTASGKLEKMRKPPEKAGSGRPAVELPAEKARHAKEPSGEAPLKDVVRQPERTIRPVDAIASGEAVKPRETSLEKAVRSIPPEDAARPLEKTALPAAVATGEEVKPQEAPLEKVVRPAAAAAPGEAIRPAQSVDAIPLTEAVQRAEVPQTQSLVQPEERTMVGALRAYKKLLREWYAESSEEEKSGYYNKTTQIGKFVPLFQKRLEGKGIEPGIAGDVARTEWTRTALSGVASEIRVLLYLTAKYGEGAVEGGITADTKPKAERTGRSGRSLTPDFVLKRNGDCAFVEVKNKPLNKHELCHIRDRYLGLRVETVDGVKCLTAGIIFALCNEKDFDRAFLEKEMRGVTVYTNWVFGEEMIIYNEEVCKLARKMPEVKKIFAETNLGNLNGLREFQGAAENSLDFIDYQMDRLERGKKPVTLGPTLTAEFEEAHRIELEKEAKGNPREIVRYGGFFTVRFEGEMNQSRQPKL